MTGTTTGDFKEFQIKNKMHLDANVILDTVQMVSVVATACHVNNINTSIVLLSLNESHSYHDDSTGKTVLYLHMI
jgi:hypothetical protein